MSLQRNTTTIWLQADDTNYYPVTLEDLGGGIIVPVGDETAPVVLATDPYVALLGSDGFIYRWSLAIVDGLVQHNIALSPDQGESSVSGVDILLGSDWWNVFVNPTTLALDITTGTPGTAPTITTQPASVSYNVGDTFHLTVVATGSTPFSYQWYKDGIAISGETGSELDFIIASLDDTATYHVVVFNAYGSATSNNAVVTITIYTPSPLPLSVGSPDGPIRWTHPGLLGMEMSRQPRRTIIPLNPGTRTIPL